MSRKDVSEEVLKNNISIISTNAQDGEDIRKIEAKFEFNSTAITCLTKESWALELVHNSYANRSSVLAYVPCVTSTGLLVNFQYHYDPIDVEFHFNEGCIFLQLLILLIFFAD